jgi:membrane protein DedA with SNARE-associated domain
LKTVMGEILHALQAHAVLLALLLPPAIRVTGHWLPEEPLMVAMGVLASRSTPERAAMILAALWLSHAATDYAVFSLGRLLGSRLDRWPRLAGRVHPVAERVAASAWTRAALIPARVLPLGRAVWLLGFGLGGVPGPAFAALDAVAVAAFLLVWCGLGWWVGPRITLLLPAARPAALWLLLAAVASAGAVVLWRRLRLRAPSATMR